MSDRDGLRQPIRVLIVDDHDVVHWGLRIMLERQSWIERSFSAHTGAEAIAQTTQHAIDLALVDLFVGAESGPDICERLHEVRPGMRLAVDLRRWADLAAGDRGLRGERVRVEGLARE